MNDTVTRLMGMVDRYWDLAYTEGKEGRTHDTANGDAAKTRQALKAELTRLFTPLSDEQIESMAKVGPVYAPDGWIERRPDEYRKELERARAAGIRIAEQAHGIGETK